MLAAWDWRGGAGREPLCLRLRQDQARRAGVFAFLACMTKPLAPLRVAHAVDEAGFIQAFRGFAFDEEGGVLVGLGAGLVADFDGIGTGEPQDLLLAEIEALCINVGLPQRMTDTGYIHCWPDPFADQLNIDLPGHREGVSLSITDGTGRHVRTMSGLTGSKIFWNGQYANGSVAPSGMYFITVFADGQRHIQRVIKQ